MRRRCVGVGLELDLHKFGGQARDFRKRFPQMPLNLLGLVFN